MSATASSPPSAHPLAGKGAAHLGHPLARSLLVLTVTTGLVDAVSYLGLGHVFTANMTGNIVLLGFGLAGGTGLPVLAPIVSLAAFLAGAGLGGWLQRRYGERRPHHLAVPLAAEVILMAVALADAAATDPHPGTVGAGILIALMAGAMGIRNAAVRSFGVPDLTTTVLTLTLTGLAAEFGRAGSMPDTLRRLAAVGSMLVGALVGALLLKTSLWLPLAVAVAAVGVTAAGYVRAFAP